MRKLIVKLIVIFALLAALLLALLMPVMAGSAHALVACQPLVHFPCTGGGIVCIDKHGRRVHHWNGRIHRGEHCIAI